MGKAADAKALDLTVRMAYEDLDPELTPNEIRKMALRQFQRLVANWDLENWTNHSQLSNPMVDRRAPVDGPYHLGEGDKRPDRPKLEWQRPNDLKESDLKACHQLLEGLLLLGVHGRAVSTGDLVKQRKIGARALYRIINQDSDAYHYLEPYIQDMKSRGRRLLDLTSEGRQLASQIRTGVIVV